MTNKHASGSFEVKLSPEAMSAVAKESGLGRMSIDKSFSGSLTASSKGEMLAYRSSVQGSAGYVAMETVSGTLDGRKGSFVFQHSSTMTRGVPTQSITVVPDSGTDELSGLSGSMTIQIEQGQHFYKFDYTLAE
jgi:hypothetical protein